MLEDERAWRRSSRSRRSSPSADQNAVFQVGGEIPIRIVTSFTGRGSSSRRSARCVNFLPKISEDGDIILTVTPEVSAPDFANAVEGVPTFRVRRASTTAKLREGRVPRARWPRPARPHRAVSAAFLYLKDIPYAGQLFRDTSYQDEVKRADGGRQAPSREESRPERRPRTAHAIAARSIVTT
jgi:hypothetical protein